jgi:ABC-type transporter Mla maintaining outer membrane lipid asymmetry ATPase subunit MlaF
VVVTHNIPSARRIGDVLAFLDEGRILDRGTPDEVRNSPHDLVQQFLSVQGGT